MRGAATIGSVEASHSVGREQWLRKMYALGARGISFGPYSSRRGTPRRSVRP
jgi:hypothetical protein